MRAKESCNKKAISKCLLPFPTKTSLCVHAPAWQRSQRCIRSMLEKRVCLANYAYKNMCALLRVQ